MQKINITPLVKPIIDAFHHGHHGLQFGHGRMIDMFGSNYADNFVALSKAPDHEASAREYLTSEDFNLEQLKELAGRVRMNFELDKPRFEDSELTEAVENYVGRQGDDGLSIKEWDVHNSSTTYFSWEDGDTLFKSYRDLVESDSDDVLQAFKTAGEDPLDWVDDSTRQSYVTDQVERLIEHLASENLWHLASGTPVMVEANTWYALGQESGRDTYPTGVVEFNGMFILPAKE